MKKIIIKKSQNESPNTQLLGNGVLRGNTNFWRSRSTCVDQF